MGARQIITDARPGETGDELTRRALAELDHDAYHVLGVEVIGDPPTACAVTVKGSCWRSDRTTEAGKRSSDP